MRLDASVSNLLFENRESRSIEIPHLWIVLHVGVQDVNGAGIGRYAEYAVKIAYQTELAIFQLEEQEILFSCLQLVVRCSVDCCGVAIWEFELPTRALEFGVPRCISAENLSNVEMVERLDKIS